MKVSDSFECTVCVQTSIDLRPVDVGKNYHTRGRSVLHKAQNGGCLIIFHIQYCDDGFCCLLCMIFPESDSS